MAASQRKRPETLTYRQNQFQVDYPLVNSGQIFACDFRADFDAAGASVGVGDGLALTAQVSVIGALLDFDGFFNAY